MKTKTVAILIGAGACTCLFWKPLISQNWSGKEEGTGSLVTSSDSKRVVFEERSKTGGVAFPAEGSFTEELLTIQGMENHREIPEFVSDLLREASLVEVREFLEVAQSHPDFSPGFRNHLFVAGYERWYEFDPTEALRKMDASALTQNRKASRMGVLLEDWASKEPAEVLAFLGEQELGGISMDASLSALARGSASGGELAVLETAFAKIKDTKQRNFALKASARTLQRDHESLLESWLPKLTPDEQNAVLAESAWILADQNIAQSLEKLNELEQREANNLPVTRSRILVKWTRKEPRAAGEWLLEQNFPETQQEELFALFFRVWLAENREKSVSWVEESIERGKLDDAFMNRVVSQ